MAGATKCYRVTPDHDSNMQRELVERSPKYADATGAPIPGPSGKYGWAWQLPCPQWTWQDLECIKPRTLRLL